MRPVQISSSQEATLHHGVSDAAASRVAFDLMMAERRSESISVILLSSLKRMEGWAEDLRFFASLENARLQVHLLPPVAEMEEDDPRAFELRCDRSSALASLLEAKRNADQHTVLLATPRSLLEPAPSPGDLQRGDELLVVIDVWTSDGYMRSSITAPLETMRSYGTVGSIAMKILHSTDARPI